MTSPRHDLGWQALRAAQSGARARDATKAASVAMRAQAAAVFDAASSRRKHEPDVAAILAASGDVLMTGADALEARAEAEALAVGVLIMLSQLER